MIDIEAVKQARKALEDAEILIGLSEFQLNYKRFIKEFPLVDVELIPFVYTDSAFVFEAKKRLNGITFFTLLDNDRLAEYKKHWES